jgi:hypothetical protein
MESSSGVGAIHCCAWKEGAAREKIAATKEK